MACARSPKSSAPAIRAPPLNVCRAPIRASTGIARSAFGSTPNKSSIWASNSALSSRKSARISGSAGSTLICRSSRSRSRRKRCSHATSIDGSIAVRTACRQASVASPKMAICPCISGLSARCAALAHPSISSAHCASASRPTVRAVPFSVWKARSTSESSGRAAFSPACWR